MTSSFHITCSIMTMLTFGPWCQANYHFNFASPHARFEVNDSQGFHSPEQNFYHDSFTPSQNRKMNVFTNLAGMLPGSVGEIKNGCPARPRCDPLSPYRTYDGSCNNLRYPLWGAANTPYSRLVPPRYSDGVHAYPRSVTGAALPQPRELSRMFLPALPVDSDEGNLLRMQWGQIIVHDMSLAADSITDPSNPTCCDTKGPLLMKSSKGELCQPPLIARDDILYIKHRQKCFDFMRTTTDANMGCRSSKSARPLSAVTHWMDASIVYGLTAQQAHDLRSHNNGQLRVDVRNDQQWPPPDQNATGCNLPPPQQICYKTGDVRVNQNPGLAMLQVVLVREHNRLARGLQAINPHWDDERTYQEARRLLIAQVQHISYSEWLPAYAGEANDSEPTDYDENVSPNVLNEHAQGAFRFFHTAIQGKLSLMSEQRFDKGFLLLPEHMGDVSILEFGAFDDLARGHATQPQHGLDRYHDKQVKDNLFRNPLWSKVGFDMKVFDIQRDRDHGLGSYNDLRVHCGLPRAKEFADFTDRMSSEDAARLGIAYAHPDDVDLSVGGMLEAKTSQLPPTYACIVHEQFRRTRIADRFFYDNPHQPAPFTPDQFREILKSSMARLMCDNTGHVTSMQPKAFSFISKENPLVLCEDYQKIPIVDLEAWREKGAHKSRRRRQQRQQQFTAK